MRNEKERIIPKKNYLIVLLLFLALVGFTFYCSSWYKELNDYYTNNSVVTEVVSEMELNSLSSFLQDNPETIIYISSSKDYSVKNFEKKFKKYILDNNLTDSILYLDLSKEENYETIDIIKNEYLPSNLKNIQNIYIPNIIYFNDGIVSDILYIKQTEISKNDVVRFFDRIELTNND